MIQKYNLRQARAGVCSLSPIALLLGLVFCSYRARELLVCWLFFGLFFAVLAVVLIGGVGAYSAGKYITERVLAIVPRTPELPIGLPEVPPEIIPGTIIDNSAACEVTAISQLPPEMLDRHPYLLIPAVATVEVSVQK